MEQATEAVQLRMKQIQNISMYFVPEYQFGYRVHVLYW
jgi:hypothetical protein